MNYVIRYKEELCHYGVKGMKWGARHDEDRVGLRRKKSNAKSKTNKLSKGAKIALGAAATTAILGGTIYLAKTGKFSSLIKAGNSVVQSQFGGSATSIIQKAGKSFSDIAKNQSMIDSINAGNPKTPNCFHTTTAYLLNSLYGKSITAKPFSGVDEISGFRSAGRDYHLYFSIFNNVKKRDYIEEYGKAISFGNAIKDIKPGSTGVLHLPGHFINYEKALDGSLTLVDPQRGQPNIIKVTSNNLNHLNSRIKVSRILDFSEASLNNEASDILKYIVK